MMTRTRIMMKELLLTISYSSPRLGVLLEELPHPPGPKPEAFYEACLDPDHNNLIRMFVVSKMMTMKKKCSKLQFVPYELARWIPITNRIFILLMI